MANVMYNRGRQGLLSDYNLLSDTVNCYLLSSGYTFNVAHTTVSDLSTGDPRGPVALTGRTITDGAFFAAATTFTEVDAPGSGSSLVLAVGTNLLAYYDVFNLAGGGTGGLTLTYNGSDVVVTWSEAGVLVLP